MGRLGMDFGQYLDEWEKDKGEVMAWYDAQTMAYPKALAVTWQQNFGQLSALAQTMLRIAAFLGPEPIPDSLFEDEDAVLAKAVRAMSAERKAGEPEKGKVKWAMAQLESFSLIKRSPEGFSLHVSA